MVKSRRGNCLVLPPVSYDPEENIDNVKGLSYNQEPSILEFRKCHIGHWSWFIFPLIKLSLSNAVASKANLLCEHGDGKNVKHRILKLTIGGKQLAKK